MAGSFLLPFDRELIKRNYEKPDFSIRCTSSVRNISEQTSKISTGEAGLTGGTRINLTPDKHIPKKKKYIKPKALSPFLPGNKRLLNKDNDDNPETTDTSLSGKYYMSHTSPDNFTEKQMTKNLQITMTNTRRKIRKFKKVMKVLIIMKLQILCVIIVL